MGHFFALSDLPQTWNHCISYLHGTQQIPFWVKANLKWSYSTSRNDALNIKSSKYLMYYVLCIMYMIYSGATVVEIKNHSSATLLAFGAAWLVAETHQGAAQIFWFILTWQHHTAAADVWCKPPVPPQSRDAALDFRKQSEKISALSSLAQRALSVMNGNRKQAEHCGGSSSEGL